MKIYSHKDLNFGFVILCHDNNIGLLKSTASSIKARYPKTPIVCATNESLSIESVEEMKKICPTYKGKNTITSLINTGMRYSRAEWNFIVCAGVTVRAKMDQRFSYFIESEKDILFPIAENKIYFVDGTLNGLFINRNTWKEVGEMDESGTLEEVKTLWAIAAIAKGVKFKAIANSKIC